MEVHLTPAQQHQLSELAAQRGRDADALAQEAISRYLAEEPALLKPSSWAKQVWSAVNISRTNKSESGLIG
jgi:hypothetical protein